MGRCSYKQEMQRKWVIQSTLLCLYVHAPQSIELYHSLKRAISVHNDMTREASTGKAFDRLFLGLRMNLRNGESHPLFADELFQKSQQYRLSTSGLSAGDRFYGTGFGSPEPDGYGINCEMHVYSSGSQLTRLC